MKRTSIFALLVATVVAACGAASSAPTTPTTAATPMPTPLPTPSLWRQVAAPKGASTAGQWIAVDSFDGKAQLALVQSPAGGGNAPVAIVLHGDGGLRQMHIDLASSLTSLGFITVTPCWQGHADPSDAGTIGCAADAPQRDAAVAVAKDVGALANAARTLPRAHRGVAVVGHSAGGTAAVLAASLDAPVDAVIALSAAYGMGQIKVRWGTSAPEQVAGLRAPVLIVHGLSDTQSNGTRPEVARSYEKLARDGGKNVEAIYIEGAPHDFPFLPQFWTNELRSKLTSFLKTHLPT